MRMTVIEAAREALALLTGRDRRLLRLSVVIQMSTAVLDLVGVILIGLVGATAVTTVQSLPPPPAVDHLASLVGLQDLSDQALVVVRAASAALVLLTKSVVSSLLTRRVFVFLANRQALVSARLSRELLARPYTFVQMRSSQETAFALINGAAAATLQLLGQLVVAVTELALLVILGLGLVIISPTVAIGAICFFAIIALGLQRAMGGWATRVGTQAAEADIQSLSAVQEALTSYREITVTDRRDLYVARIQSLRWQAAKVTADLLFIQMLPKYLFEGALVIGGFGLAIFLFSTQDSVAAVGTLALFLAAASRVMPSLLRLQGAALGLRSSAGTAAPTFELAFALGRPEGDPEPARSAEVIRRQIEIGYPSFASSVRLDAVCVTYPSADERALANVTLEVPEGGSIALVGKSGSGKSTLADVILGVIVPDSGTASLGGVPPSDALRLWPGAIGYVPQDVVIVSGTIRENVALGLPADAIDDDLVWLALERAHLSTFLREDRQGLDTILGERGLRISGGQRQRLGIARALYTRPKLLVLDEATSALDAETEQQVSRTIADLGGEVTSVIIAHRLSTVRNVDRVFYLDNGRIAASGTFAEVRRSIPSFANQASLMGL